MYMTVWEISMAATKDNEKAIDYFKETLSIKENGESGQKLESLEKKK
jgi:hypothetical protein